MPERRGKLAGEVSMKKYQLMAPGPTPVPSQVLLAMAEPIIHHRTPEYEALFSGVREGLKALCRTREDVIILACSGTGAMEAAVANTLSAGDAVVVAQAGKFGDRPRLRPGPDRADRALRAYRGPRASGGSARRAPRGPRGADPAQRDLDGRAARRARLRGRDAPDRRPPDRRRRLESRHRAPRDGRVGRRPRRGRLAEGAHAPPRTGLLRAFGASLGADGNVDPAEVLLRPRRRAKVRPAQRGPLHARREPGRRPARGAPDAGRGRAGAGLPAPRPDRKSVV